MVLSQWFPCKALHHNSLSECLPFINVQFSCGTGHPNHMVALLSPAWMPSNPTESFLGAPGCLVMTVRWLLAAVLMQMHIWVCSHDIFPILWSKTCLWMFSREKPPTWDAVKSAFAFTCSRKFSQFGFVSFTGFASQPQLIKGKIITLEIKIRVTSQHQGMAYFHTRGWHDGVLGFVLLHIHPWLI